MGFVLSKSPTLPTRPTVTQTSTLSQDTCSMKEKPAVINVPTYNAPFCTEQLVYCMDPPLVNKKNYGLLGQID